MTTVLFKSSFYPRCLRRIVVGCPKLLVGEKYKCVSFQTERFASRAQTKHDRNHGEDEAIFYWRSYQQYGWAAKECSLEANADLCKRSRVRGNHHSRHNDTSNDNHDHILLDDFKVTKAEAEEDELLAMKRYL